MLKVNNSGSDMHKETPMFPKKEENDDHQKTSEKSQKSENERNGPQNPKLVA